MRQYKVPDFKVGDKVAYTVQFLRSIGMSHTEMSHARGNVINVHVFGSQQTPRLIEINWSDKGLDLPSKVLAPNLALVGPNPRFTNVD